jgi:multidrug efflux pump subunit AcrA (membrane-fusion protein)
MSKLTPNVPQYKKHHPVFRHLMGGWSFLVWLAMIAVTYLSYRHGGSLLPLNGQVQVVKEKVACMETARLSQIKVCQGQQVKCGDVIAQMDTSLIDLKISQLSAELRLERQQEGLESMDRQRRLMTDAQDLRKTINETEIEQERDQSARTALAERYATLADLIKKRLVSDAEYVKIGVDLSELEPKLKKYPEIIAQYQQDLADVLHMRQLMDAAGLTLHAAPDGQSLEDSINNDPQLKELRLTREDYTLRAASNGTIGSIVFQEGEIVAAGATVVEIIKDVPPVIETFVPEALAIYVVVGQEFRLSTLTSPYQYYRATITSITPQVVGQTDTSNSMIERVIRGRRLLLTPIGDTLLVPGESIMIEQAAKPWF